LALLLPNIDSPIGLISAKAKVAYMKGIILFAAVCLGLSSYTSAFGQDYNYRYGGSRVINQSQIGLPNPSSTYIGSGTLSKSAQGAIETGAQANPNLPKVNVGGFIGTPGDNLYGNNPIRSQEAKRLRAAQQQRTRIIYIRQPEKPAAPTYVPDKNVALEYSSAPAESSDQSGHSAQPVQTPASGEQKAAQ
jgi:hypothetical protein